MTTRKKRLLTRRTITAWMLALGAGFGAVQFQPHDASVRTLATVFLAAALPVLAAHWQHWSAQRGGDLVELKPPPKP